MKVIISKDEVAFLVANFGKEQIIKALETQFNNLFNFTEVINELYNYLFCDSFVGKVIQLNNNNFEFYLTLGE